MPSFLPPVRVDRLLIVLLLALASAVRAQPRPVPARSVDLVVLIAVDQLRADYLDRYRTQLTHGFARLRGAGVLFPNGIQDHALTETAPGHASMLSGRVPAHTHIWSNSGGVEDPSFPLLDGLALESPGTVRGASPKRFIGTTLVDWLRAADPNVRSLGVSRKDRAAILPIGRSQAPYSQSVWFVDGRFTTSTYYADSLPSWIRAWNSKFDLARVAAQRWTLALPESQYRETDDAAWENGGKDRVFPHEPGASSKLVSRLERTPWMDSITLDIALAGVRARGLGLRADARQPDVLSVSLSTTDAIGHDFGPDSREIHDHLVRLDRWLGAFLDSLNAIVPTGRTIFALTADHGVSPMPERLAHDGMRGARIDVASIAKASAEQLRTRWSTDFGIEFDNGILTADVDALVARGIDVDSLARALSAAASKQQGVRRIYTAKTLAAALSTDADAARWKRSLPAGLGWLIAGVAEDGYVFSDGAKAEHGTMHPESRSVPILIVVPGVNARSDARVARTIDIAPTIAALLGVKPTEALDGRSLDISARR